MFALGGRDTFLEELLFSKLATFERNKDTRFLRRVRKRAERQSVTGAKAREEKKPRTANALVVFGCRGESIQLTVHALVPLALARIPETSPKFSFKTLNQYHNQTKTKPTDVWRGMKRNGREKQARLVKQKKPKARHLVEGSIPYSSFFSHILVPSQWEIGSLLKP